MVPPRVEKTGLCKNCQTVFLKFTFTDSQTVKHDTSRGETKIKNVKTNNHLCRKAIENHIFYPDVRFIYEIN